MINSVIQDSKVVLLKVLLISHPESMRPCCEQQRIFLKDARKNLLPDLQSSADSVQGSPFPQSAAPCPPSQHTLVSAPAPVSLLQVVPWTIARVSHLKTLHIIPSESPFITYIYPQVWDLDCRHHVAPYSASCHQKLIKHYQ